MDEKNPRWVVFYEWTTDEHETRIRSGVAQPIVVQRSWTFRETFPDLIAYGFFPHREMTLYEAAPLIHSANERIPVADLGTAADFFTHAAREICG